MLHHLVGATIQVANLVNFNCHPLLEDGNEASTLNKNSCLSNAKK